MAQPTLDTADAAWVLTEELLFMGLTLTDLLASLLEEAPEGASPQDGEATIELVVSICRPSLAGVSPDECLAAAALIRAIRDRVLEALHDGAILSETSATTA